MQVRAFRKMKLEQTQFLQGVEHDSELAHPEVRAANELNMSSSCSDANFKNLKSSNKEIARTAQSDGNMHFKGKLRMSQLPSNAEVSFLDS